MGTQILPFCTLDSNLLLEKNKYHRRPNNHNRYLNDRTHIRCKIHYIHLHVHLSLGTKNNSLYLFSQSLDYILNFIFKQAPRNLENKSIDTTILACVLQKV